MASNSLPGRLTPAFKISLPDSVQEKAKRNRPSKLDPHFEFIASSLLHNSPANSKCSDRVPKAANKNIKKKSLELICKELQEKYGVSANKSTLSRYLNKHPLLKLL